MASHGDSTRVRGTPPPPPPAAAPAGGGIELTTLFLSAVASAAAAYITSKIWAPGTLFSAAMSPVIVALVKEGLRKPTEKVVNVVPVVVPSPSRWTRTGPSDPGLVPDGAPAPAPPVDPAAPHVVLPPVANGDHGPVNVYSTRGRRLRWRLAVITGLLGFVACVLFFTVPELIAGKSLGRGSGEATTIFGGRTRHHRTSTTPTTTQQTAPTTTSTTSTTPSTPTTATQPPAQTTVTPKTATPPAATTPAPAAPVQPSTSAPPAQAPAPAAADQQP
jgi:hypothetical protein